ncbi:MFS transporter [Asticcacaulis sp. DXS10W]|uniref:MFS transporter n=1 Tax=Asticcacaulis currens TaxID=2984210 RepID=A0ABT5IDN2_9CAUL|nr:MFS transporter [Asticcacaulis currens]MDC7694259.1 MFS transporter [Asticcacaulis currens]
MTHPDQATSAAPSPNEAQWIAVASLGLGVFGLVTAEFLPASLLTAISTDLHVSDGSAGQAVTATAIVGAIAAPAMPIVTRSIDRKLVMTGLTLLLILSNALAAVATDLTILLGARILLGVALGGFWSMAGALAMRLVPDHLFARAMSVILTGVSLATVCAAPIGAYIGAEWGWRTAFGAAAILSVVAFGIQIFAIPKLPSIDNPNLQTLGELLNRPNVRTALMIVLLVASGHFAGFTYIRPFLDNVAHFDVNSVSYVLFAFGIGGFLGNIAGGFIAERSEKWAIGLGACIVVVTSLVLILVPTSGLAVSVAIAMWGFAFSAFPVGFQTWIVRAAPDQAEGAGGLLVSAFQIAIASGAILGGLMVDRFGATGAIVYTAAGMCLGAALALALGPKPLKS